MKSVGGDLETRRRRKLRRKEAPDEFADSDDTFAYIAGYTAAGFAYGVTWEEWEELEKNSAFNSESNIASAGSSDADADVDEWDSDEWMEPRDPCRDIYTVVDDDSEDIPF